MEEYIDQVLHFWFEELEPSQHWIKDAILDEKIGLRFGALHARAKEGQLSNWRTKPQGRLAEIIVLDQFSRNIFRGEAESFACDTLARDLSREAIELGVDEALPEEQRAFIYMPLMHSEELEDHHLALKMFDQPGMSNNLDFEKKHLEIIKRFGRYPHRNEILGRESTPEEIAFLTEPGSRF